MTNHTSSPIVIIVAMESERTHLEQLISGWQHSARNAWPTMQTDYRGTSLVVLRCGIGMVASAAATEHAIAIYDPLCVLNFGCAGAHTRDILPGDVVIGTGLVSHGRMRLSAHEGMIPMDVPFTVAGEPDLQNELHCSPDLVVLAQQAAKEAELENWPARYRLPMHPEDGAVRVHTGVVSSADVWIQDPVRLDAMHQRTGSLCEDMEAAAIGQVAAFHGVPFLTIKDISNNEFHAESEFSDTESTLPLSEVGKRATALTLATIAGIVSQGV